MTKKSPQIPPALPPVRTPAQELDDLAIHITFLYQAWSKRHGWGGNLVPVYDNNGVKSFEARNAAPLPAGPPAPEKVAAAAKVLETAHRESLKQ